MTFSTYSDLFPEPDPEDLKKLWCGTPYLTWLQAHERGPNREVDSIAFDDGPKDSTRPVTVPRTAGADLRDDPELPSDTDSFTCLGMFAHVRGARHRAAVPTPEALSEDLTPGTGRRSSEKP